MSHAPHSFAMAGGDQQRATTTWNHLVSMDPQGAGQPPLGQHGFSLAIFETHKKQIAQKHPSMCGRLCKAKRLQLGVLLQITWRKDNKQPVASLMELVKDSSRWTRGVMNLGTYGQVSRKTQYKTGLQQLWERAIFRRLYFQGIHLRTFRLSAALASCLRDCQVKCFIGTYSSKLSSTHRHSVGVVRSKIAHLGCTSSCRMVPLR